MTTNTITSTYAGFLKGWNTKECGPKVTHELLEQAHGLGLRPGIQALSIAMTLRPEGCSVRQFLIAGGGGPANNIRRELENKKLLKVTVEGKPYVYHGVVTDKGKKAIDAYKAALAAGDDPAAKTKKKGKKAAKKAKKGDTTVTVAPKAEPEAQADAANTAPQVETGDVSQSQNEA